MSNFNYTPDGVNEYLNNFTLSFQGFTPFTPHFAPKELSKMIDHTLLKPDAGIEDIDQLCREALKYGFASVCVNSSYVSRCFNIVKDSDVKVCSVIGFPLGASASEVKINETEFAVINGAAEVDMVINIGQLKSKDYIYVYEDIKAVSDQAHSYNAKCKVIIETCLLTDHEKTAACLIAMDAGADYVKTSTGFSKGGAVVKDVALMKYIVEDKLKVKASGGIKTAEDALAMISFGASRIGTSSGVHIIDTYKQLYSHGL
jgi:deoxyribose-phosphate aldolase